MRVGLGRQRRFFRRNTSLPGRKFPLKTRVIFIPLFILAGFFYAEHRLRPALHEISRARAVQIATQSINKAVREQVVQHIRYEDLITVKVDNRGRVVLMQPNTGEINRLAAEATIAVQKELEKTSRTRIHIPLGQLLGSQVMAGRGPDIPIEVIPAGAVESRVFDRFEQAGINQTRHKIYLEIQTRVRIVIPLTFANAEVRTEVPLAEAVIMGEVPQVYFGGPPVLNLPQNPGGQGD
jgi:sporulation protein YunB